MQVRSRSLLGVAGTAFALTLLVPAGTASAAADRDTVSGSGNQGIADFEFDAFNQGTGPDSPAGGLWRAQNEFIEFNGPITCLHVDGNRAGFIYPVDESSSPEFARGQNVLISVEDNGAVGDTMGFAFLGPEAAGGFGIGCAPGPTPLTISGEGVTVHDAS